MRQRGKKYYVYKIEKDSKGNVKEIYIGSLDKIIETYLKLKAGVLGDSSPKGLEPGLEPGTFGSTGVPPSL
ncbi:putative integrase [Sulfuracidifex tepidarius]|uniref:putative integrase n=1 Tax=Sulfuracidifex tepidarius TaxID=1294262 RepID=UPI000A01E0CF|nr:putative integrase [Sulfuracidifex tepidarius]